MAFGAGSLWRSYLLTDIVGSVALWERDAPAMSAAVARHDELVASQVVAFGGELVRSRGEGDSTFSVFERAPDAVAAAVGLQRSLSDTSWKTPAPLRVRAAVHTGEAAPRAGDWYGPSVNRAARLRGLAGPDQILVSGVTASLATHALPSGAELVYRGRRLLKGIDRPEEIWEVVASEVSGNGRTAGEWAGARSVVPAARDRFVGRAADVAGVSQLLEAHRLVTITGAAGCGKTRLAMVVAQTTESEGDHVWLAELAAVQDEGLVAGVIGGALGVEAAGEAESGPTAAFVAASLPAGLLMVDNCEHVLGASARTIANWLDAVPQLRVLVTSQAPLGVAGERTWPLRPLAVPETGEMGNRPFVEVESVALLLDRAGAVRPELELRPADRLAVEDICRALDGLPLAIELAAGRLRSLGWQDLAARVDDLTGLLVRPGATHDAERHDSLREAIRWSVGLLSPSHRQLAEQLSVFSGGFRLDAVDAVCGPVGGTGVLDAIDELVARSLVTVDARTARYRLLEPIRQHLASALEESGHGEAVRRAHCTWTTAMCKELGSRLHADQRAISARLREESGNIDVALRWGLGHDRELALRIGAALGQYWYWHDQAGGRRWTDKLVAASAGTAPRVRGGVLLSAGILAQNDQRWDQAFAWLREALAIARTEGSLHGELAARFWLGTALVWGSGAADNPHLLDEAESHMRESLRMASELGVPILVGWSRLFLARVALWRRDVDEAERQALTVIEELTAAGVFHPVGQALRHLAIVASLQGRHAEALAHLREAMRIYTELEASRDIAGVLGHLASELVLAGQPQEALRELAHMVSLIDRLGLRPGPNHFAVAAAAHRALGHRELATAALAAHDALPAGGSVRPFPIDLEATRAALDPDEVRASGAIARVQTLDHLVATLISDPARHGASRLRAGQGNVACGKAEGLA